VFFGLLLCGLWWYVLWWVSVDVCVVLVLLCVLCDCRRFLSAISLQGVTSECIVAETLECVNRASLVLVLVECNWN